MEVIKKNIGYFYIALVVHLYIILFLLISFDKDFLSSILNPTVVARQQPSVEETIVDTATESVEKPLSGMISDKANVNSAPVSGENNYNYLNPELKASPYQRNSG